METVSTISTLMAGSRVITVMAVVQVITVRMVIIVMAVSTNVECIQRIKVMKVSKAMIVIAGVK